MTKEELCKVLSENIKKYRKGIFTQESLAEKTGLSVQQINGIECGRKFVSTESLLRIANALNVEVYQLFVSSCKNPVIIEKTPENEKIRREIHGQVVKDVRLALNNALDKLDKTGR